MRRLKMYSRNNGRPPIGHKPPRFLRCYNPIIHPETFRRSSILHHRILSFENTPVHPVSTVSPDNINAHPRLNIEGHRVLICATSDLYWCTASIFSSMLDLALIYIQIPPIYISTIVVGSLRADGASVTACIARMSRCVLERG